MTDQLTQTRTQRADAYFAHHLRGQREWYGARASRYKQLYRGLAVMVLVCGALTAFLQLFTATSYSDMVPWVTAGLGLVITLSKGLDQIIRPGESWLGYRKASEAMKREYRLYINKVGPYARDLNEDEAYGLLVEQIENIISEEQQLFLPREAPVKSER